ncbi:hypothetical protein ABTX35_41070, partial [Streptomyces sp. NPDC096080]|uniref:hypothetical protein n=1 Tax=Streptomyces sp. NPDC096080 TaxID=3156693 RepID=UPI003331595C
TLVPEKVVIGTCITLLFFALMSTAFAIGVSVLVVRVLLLRGRTPAEVSDVGKAGPRRWTLLLRHRRGGQPGGHANAPAPAR